MTVLMTGRRPEVGGVLVGFFWAFGVLSFLGCGTRALLVGERR